MRELRHASGSPEAVFLERTFPATVSFVKEARDAVADALEPLGIEERVLDEVRLCVSEAVTNAVRHAYGGGSGTIEISVAKQGEGAVVRVRDFGSGIVSSGRNGAGGFGLTIIATLTEHYALTSVSGVGTEVSMAFGTTLGASLC